MTESVVKSFCDVSGSLIVCSNQQIGCKKKKIPALVQTLVCDSQRRFSQEGLWGWDLGMLLLCPSVCSFFKIFCYLRLLLFLTVSGEVVDEAPDEF